MILVALAVPSAAWGHATLVRTDPANGSVLAQPPVAVQVIFDDRVQVGPGVEAIRNGGGSVLAGRPRVEGGRTLVVPVRRELADGAYSVRWSIISDDGHLESGVLAFAVGAGQLPPTAVLSAESTQPKAGAVASRWLFLAGLLGAVGIALFALVARVRGETIALTLSSSAVLAALGAAEEAHRVGLQTRAGTALGAGFVAAVVVASLAGAATLERRALGPALVLALGLTIVPSVAGHALDPGLNRVNVVADVLHVLGAAAWVGALLGLVLVRAAPQRRAVALAAGGVVVLGVTGVVRASFELLHLSQLWNTSYGITLLVKTAILLVALAAGWFVRTRLRVRAGVELGLVALLVVAVSVLVLLRPGRNVTAKPLQQVQATQLSPAPPAPPAGAYVLAKEVGPVGLAIAVESRRITVIVLSPAGGGLNGLDVRLDGYTTTSCGQGCYRADLVPGRAVNVEIGSFGPIRQTSFALPRFPRTATDLVRRLRKRYRALTSVRYVEQLRSDPTHAITARWLLERPNRIQYSIPGGAEGIVVGTRRWDRTTPRGRWRESQQSTLPQPATQWNYATNAHVIADDGSTKTVSFADPTIPEYFTVRLDAKTLLPRVLHMTAAAHFMTDSYESFNSPRAIFPPR
ncbi:MAG: copper resistance protein CopC/CopD [Actinomycetota bacterium]|nr:copper resistance protein CopC/CopD [Actinomycetota bacterium]